MATTVATEYPSNRSPSPPAGLCKNSWMDPFCIESLYKNAEQKIYAVSSTVIILNGLYGTVNVLIGFSLEDIADNVGTTSTDLGVVFVTRFAGIIVGMSTVISFEPIFSGIPTIMFMQVLQALCLFAIPFCTNVVEVHIICFLFGLAYGMYQVSGASYLRTLHQGAAKGIWMTYYLLTYCSFAVVLAFIQLSGIDFVDEYMSVGGMYMFSWFLLFMIPDPTSDEQLLAVAADNAYTEGLVRDVEMYVLCGNIKFPHHLWVEFTCASMLAMNMGAKEAVIYYIETYIDDTGIDVDKTWTYLCLVGSLGIGYWTFALVQKYITAEIFMLATIFTFIAQVIPLVILTQFPDNANVFMAMIGIYGFISPPSISLCFDLCFRLTYQSTSSTFIMLLGLVVGAQLVPYIVSLIWNVTDNPMSLFYCAELFALGASVLVPVAGSLSYIPKTNLLHNFGFVRLHRVNSYAIADDDVGNTGASGLLLRIPSQTSIRSAHSALSRSSSFVQRSRGNTLDFSNHSRRSRTSSNRSAMGDVGMDLDGSSHGEHSNDDVIGGSMSENTPLIAVDRHENLDEADDENTDSI